MLVLNTLCAYKNLANMKTNLIFSNQFIFMFIAADDIILEDYRNYYRKIDWALKVKKMKWSFSYERVLMVLLLFHATCLDANRLWALLIAHVSFILNWEILRHVFERLTVLVFKCPEISASNYNFSFTFAYIFYNLWSNDHLRMDSLVFYNFSWILHVCTEHKGF